MTFTPPGQEPPEPPPTPPPPAPPVPGWWLASDGNWYPPQAQPGAAPGGAPQQWSPPPRTGPPMGPPMGPPQQYGRPPASGQPPPYASPPGYGPAQHPGSPYGYTPYAPARGTNPFAIASLVTSLLWIYWIGSILAIVFGFVALGQIKQRPQGGRGLATAGLIIGFIGVGILVLAVFLIALGGSSEVRFSSVRN